MEVTRIDSKRNMAQAVDTVQIRVGDGKHFTITEQFGELRIHAHGDFIAVKPCCANEILIFSYDT